jgi:hypothetical protein
MRLLWALLFVGGCYAPTPPDGVACGTNPVCPESQFCAFGKCVREMPACVPVEAGAGALNIPVLDLAPVLDGDLADWPTCFVEVNESTAALVRDLGPGGKYAPGRFSIAASGGRIFVGAELKSVAPLGDHEAPDVYLNSAISVYFDASGDCDTARYDDDAAQIVVDHANRMGAFRSGNGGVISLPIESATKVYADTFVIEMSLGPEALGVSEFAPTIGFDIGLVGGDGEVMTSELVWHQACEAPACECSNGQSAPFCDSRQFGTATFTH